MSHRCITPILCLRQVEGSVLATAFLSQPLVDEVHASVAQACQAMDVKMPYEIELAIHSILLELC